MPAWGPGNSVFFVSDRGGRNNVWATQSEQAMLAARGGSAPAYAGAKALTPMGQTATAHGAKAPNAASHPAPAYTAGDSDHQAEPGFEPEIANVPTDDEDHSSHP